MSVAQCIAAAATLFLVATVSHADDGEKEIKYLLSSIGKSDCSFIRNGSAHSAEDAESHLAMKYERGKRYVSSAETFIDRLASGSSLSRKPYQIDCPESPPVPSAEWLTKRLGEYRSAEASN